MYFMDNNGVVESMYERMHVYMTICVYVKLNNELSKCSIDCIMSNKRVHTHART